MEILYSFRDYAQLMQFFYTSLIPHPYSPFCARQQPSAELPQFMQCFYSLLELMNQTSGVAAALTSGTYELLKSRRTQPNSGRSGCSQLCGNFAWTFFYYNSHAGEGGCGLRRYQKHHPLRYAEQINLRVLWHLFFAAFCIKGCFSAQPLRLAALARSNRQSLGVGHNHNFDSLWVLPKMKLRP